MGKTFKLLLYICCIKSQKNILHCTRASESQKKSSKMRYAKLNTTGARIKTQSAISPLK